MSQAAEQHPSRIGLFLNPVAQRRIDFQQISGEQFERLFLADGTEQASDLLSHQQVDLLIIDLERFDRSFDLAAIGQLIALREGARTLVLCPFACCGWLPELMAFGPVSYAILPLVDDGLRQAVAAHISDEQADAPRVAELRDLLDASARLPLSVRSHPVWSALRAARSPLCMRLACP